MFSSTFPIKTALQQALQHNICCQLMPEVHSMLQFYTLDLVCNGVRAILVTRVDTGLGICKAVNVAEDGHPTNQPLQANTAPGRKGGMRQGHE